tara:strand:+ start:1055 stop:1954 length:900 start_codon:yes stop_codon:yes gene_type:complete
MHISLDSALGRQRRLNSVGESLLQIAPDPSIALSLRSLTGGDPLVVRVRRSSDNLEQDFTASEVSSGALVDFVGSGNDGFVETWYDQGGSKNATQTNTTNQPKIVESGSLITETRSGVTTAAIKFTSDSGTPANSDFLQTSSTYVSTAVSAITTCLVVPCQDDSSEEKGILGKNNSNNRVSIDHNSSNGYRFNMPARREYANNGQIIGDVDLYFNVVAGTTANTDDECFRNNTQLTGNTNTVPSVGADMNQIGSRRGGTSSAKGTDGNYQEIVIYSSDLRSQGADIRNEIINHYSLPQD